MNETIDMPEDLDAEEAAEELEAPEELTVEDEDDIDDAEEDDEPEATEDEEEANGPDASREALRKFIDLHQLLGAFHQRVTKQGYRDRGRILGLLQLKDGIETKGMAQILGIHVPELNAILEKLEAEKLIERTSTDVEKRWATVTLTEAGRNAKIPSENITEFLFDGFTDEELEVFADSLDRITKNLEGELGQSAASLLKEQRMRKPAERPEGGRGRDDRDRGGRGRDDRKDRGGFGDRGGRGRDGRGGFDDRKRGPKDGRSFDRDRKRAPQGERRDFDRERGGRGGDRFNRDDRDDRGGRGGFGGGRGHGGGRGSGRGDRW